MEHIATLIFMFVQTCAISYALWKTIIADMKALIASNRAEAAAKTAVEHSRANAALLVGLAGDMKELKTNTNHIQEALTAAAREAGEAAGEKRGIAIGRATEPKE